MNEKTVVITGASSGIGRAASVIFAGNNAKVIALGRNKDELNALREEVERKGGNLTIYLADVAETAEVEEFFNFIEKNFGQVDVLVNAAGIIKNGSLEQASLADWDETMNINLRSVFLLMKMCVPYLEKTKGNIVNVSSVTGLRAFPNVIAYCVSKAAIDQLTRCTALELAPKGIRVNAVNPGVVVTNLHKKGGMEEENYQAFLEHSKTTHPLGRVGQASEVAELIYFLASDKAAWITGATYEIDGGRAQTCAR
ncbi:MAG: SDR family oxidoreductase [Acidobacteriota bacterium]|nr:SDR family oxidoreductase [Acidobacteriota bacterium]